VGGWCPEGAPSLGGDGDGCRAKLREQIMPGTEPGQSRLEALRHTCWDCSLTSMLYTKSAGHWNSIAYWCAQHCIAGLQDRCTSAYWSAQDNRAPAIMSGVTMNTLTMSLE
jgi:hypothetical protein